MHSDRISLAEIGHHSVSNSEAGQDSLEVSKIMEKGERRATDYLQSTLARVDVDEQALCDIDRATWAGIQYAIQTTERLIPKTIIAAGNATGRLEPPNLQR
jgi:hypothetical protein